MWLLPPQAWLLGEPFTRLFKVFCRLCPDVQSICQIDSHAVLTSLPPPSPPLYSLFPWFFSVLFPPLLILFFSLSLPRITTKFTFNSYSTVGNAGGVRGHTYRTDVVALVMVNSMVTNKMGWRDDGLERLAGEAGWRDGLRR